VTVAHLVDDLLELRELAIEHRQISAGVPACKEIGILTGLRIDRREVGSPGEFAALSDEELVAWIEAEEDGARRGAQRGLGCGDRGAESERIRLRENAAVSVSVNRSLSRVDHFPRAADADRSRRSLRADPRFRPCAAA
jgi:hypothetical protein